MRPDFAIHVDFHIPSSLAPNDLYLFSGLETDCGRRYFDTDRELKNYVLDCFQKLKSYFYGEDIYKLISKLRLNI